VNTRTWQNAIEAVTETKLGGNKERWLRVVKDPALVPLLPQIIIETKAEALLACLRVGTVSTNVFLRRLHNFCVDMNWLPWPLIPKRQWPVVRFKDKRAITVEEHARIVEPRHALPGGVLASPATGKSTGGGKHPTVNPIITPARLLILFSNETKQKGVTHENKT